MVRWSSSWIAVVVLGAMMPVARADDPPCPSQNPQPGSTAAASAAATAAKKPGASDDIDVTTDQATLGLNGASTLNGHVEVRQGEREIRANQVQYDSNGGTVTSEGHIDYTDPLVHMTGAGGSYSAAAGADFRQAQFELRQRAARGSAQELKLTPQGVISLKGVTFTTCPLNDESWKIKAQSIVLDTRNKVGTGRDAQVDFMGVPLLYLPWMSFPLGTERKSGFLFPSIGNTSDGGAQLAVPYYWNIAPNADFTFEPMVYSKRGADLGGDLRFLTQSQRGELDWNYLPDDRAFGDSRSRVRFTDLAELPADFRLDVHAENVSDTNYFEDISQGPEGASTPFVERRATLSYRSEHWVLDAEAQQYQTIDVFNLPPGDPDRPYARVPRIVLDADYGLGPNGVLHYGFDSELVNFLHSEQPVRVTSGWRADVMPRLALDLTGPGYFLRPALAWRATQYELDDLGPGQLRRAPSRTLPIASLDTGLVFERASGSHDQRKLTLEPRLLYVDVPYRNQSQLPVFDTALPDLNPVQLFRTNRYVGADRVSDADQVSVGVTSRLLDAQSGRQFISGTFGQTYYFETPRVTLPGEVPPSGKRSDFVAQLALTAFQDWGADIGVQWDPENERSERTTVNLQYKPAPNSVINLAYRYERFVTSTELVPQVVGGVVTLVPQTVQQGFDQIELSAAWPIRRNWNVFLRDVYSLRDPVQNSSTELERFVGFEYRACCWRVRLGARRYVNSHDPNAGQTTGIWLQLELAGLASVGSASDAFLTEAIRGYSPPETTQIKAQGPLRGVW
ncbi:MAG TPA: LPS-assembly protein LptD [Steroidobacteraceae bacterium]|nr:LPS-assembly protein LptD [Steroidobacteraceae bacterium]